MATITARFDLGVFPPAAVVAATHRFTGAYAVRIERTENVAIVTLTPHGEPLSGAEDALHDAVLDEALREMVRLRTQVIHDTLVRAAYAGAQAALP